VTPLLDVVYVILLFDLTGFYHVDEASHLMRNGSGQEVKFVCKILCVFFCAYAAESLHIC
jgi:hypothetical protein